MRSLWPLLCVPILVPSYVSINLQLPTSVGPSVSYFWHRWILLKLGTCWLLSFHSNKKIKTYFLFYLICQLQKIKNFSFHLIFVLTPLIKKIFSQFWNSPTPFSGIRRLAFAKINNRHISYNNKIILIAPSCPCIVVIHFISTSTKEIYIYICIHITHIYKHT